MRNITLFYKIPCHTKTATITRYAQANLNTDCCHIGQNTLLYAVSMCLLGLHLVWLPASLPHLGWLQRGQWYRKYKMTNIPCFHPSLWPWPWKKHSNLFMMIMITYHRIKFGCNRISSLANMVETAIIWLNPDLTVLWPWRLQINLCWMTLQLMMMRHYTNSFTAMSLENNQ